MTENKDDAQDKENAKQWLFRRSALEELNTWITTAQEDPRTTAIDIELLGKTHITVSCVVRERRERDDGWLRVDPEMEEMWKAEETAP